MRNWIHAGDARVLMTVSAHDVADEFRRRDNSIGRAKLHKLLYYAQGWHLVLADEPMFPERIEAWANGPVVAELWADERYERPRPAPRPLNELQLATIDYVVSRYGRFSGVALIRQTHLEDPWREASETDDAWSTANPELTFDALRQWFEQDDDYRSHVADVERLRARTDVYSFASTPRTPELDAAVGRASRGERVCHTRP
jgi:uncharacterized phage-associated protein